MGQNWKIPLAWTIDVCRICGQVNPWPGCQHWQRFADWTVAITVRPSPADARRLADVMEAAHRETRHE